MTKRLSVLSNTMVSFILLFIFIPNHIAFLQNPTDKVSWTNTTENFSEESTQFTTLIPTTVSSLMNSTLTPSTQGNSSSTVVNLIASSTTKRPNRLQIMRDYIRRAANRVVVRNPFIAFSKFAAKILTDSFVEFEYTDLLRRMGVNITAMRQRITKVRRRITTSKPFTTVSVPVSSPIPQLPSTTDSSLEVLSTVVTSPPTTAENPETTRLENETDLPGTTKMSVSTSSSISSLIENQDNTSIVDTTEASTETVKVSIISTTSSPLSSSIRSQETSTVEQTNSSPLEVTESPTTFRSLSTSIENEGTTAKEETTDSLLETTGSPVFSASTVSTLVEIVANITEANSNNFSLLSTKSEVFRTSAFTVPIVENGETMAISVENSSESTTTKIGN